MLLFYLLLELYQFQFHNKYLSRHSLRNLNAYGPLRFVNQVLGLRAQATVCSSAYILF